MLGGLGFLRIAEAIGKRYYFSMQPLGEAEQPRTRSGRSAGGFFLAVLGVALVHYAATLGTVSLPRNGFSDDFFRFLSWPLLRIGLKSPPGLLFWVLFLNSILWAGAGVGLVVLFLKWGGGKTAKIIRLTSFVAFFSLVIAYGVMISDLGGPFFSLEFPVFLFPAFCIFLFAFALLPVVLPSHHLSVRIKNSLKTASTFSSILLILVSLLLVIWLSVPRPNLD